MIVPGEMKDAHEKADGVEESTAPRILVVDDEEIMRAFLKEVLADQGYEIDLAASGREAVDAS